MQSTPTTRRGGEPNVFATVGLKEKATVFAPTQLITAETLHTRSSLTMATMSAMLDGTALPSFFSWCTLACRNSKSQE